MASRSTPGLTMRDAWEIGRVPRIAIVAEGDANSTDCWSGSAQRFVQSLRKFGAAVDVYDAALYAWPRAVAAVRSYHPVRARWRQRYGLGTHPFNVKSTLARRALLKSRIAYDAVVQIGATFSLNRAAIGSAQYILYCDSNIAYSRRGAPYSAASRLNESEYRDAFEREEAVYDSADRIWTMSDALASSFHTDFNQSPEKTLTIYAGLNNPPRIVTDTPRQRRILFVGKDHERKGSRVLLRAFEIVRSEIPDAELHMVGRAHQADDPRGVMSYGVVSRSSDAGAALLDGLFATSAVYCMPSRYEPFGIAFLEAMSARLPCIGVSQWAMPEIIEDRVTGWLVADADEKGLARVIIRALRNADQCERMGELGRKRVMQRFTWDKVAERAIADIRNARLLSSSSASSMFSP
ncbi:MAG TPA: glycosyltransferase family 4 protein [Gemmatimonadaceae bacterium]|nr:glycosyltransferase family 4 protein [Gemmatimonadaceae bacterium]